MGLSHQPGSTKARVLVTGGAGYVGSVLVPKLLRGGYRVRVLDSLLWGRSSLDGVIANPDFELVQGDLRDNALVKSAVAGCQAIVHLAGIVGDPACAKEPAVSEDVNWKASVNLWEEAKAQRVERFIFASTCSNYGKMVGDGFVSEKSELRPVSLYAELKVRFEKHILAEAKKDSPSPVCLRFATAYGLSPRMRFDLTVNEFAKTAVDGEELLVFGKQFWRPYCHTEDLSEACRLVLDAPREKIHAEVFNVGDSNENYQKEMIVSEIKKIIPTLKVKYVEKVEDPRDYRVDFEKIKAVLRFSVSRRVPDGILEIKNALEARRFDFSGKMIYHNS